MSRTRKSPPNTSPVTITGEFCDAATLVENHGLTATEDRVIEFIQLKGSGCYSFAVTEDHKKIIVVIE